MNRAKHIALIATALVALSPALAQAQQKPAKPATAAAHPDLSGFWGPSLGKPDPAMLRGILARHRLQPAEVAMVGDRIYTDIAMARRVSASNLVYWAS